MNIAVKKYLNERLPEDRKTPPLRAMDQFVKRERVSAMLFVFLITE